MSIEYTAEVPSDARWCRVQAFCTYDSDLLVAEWSTPDGELVVFSESIGQGFIGGWMPTDEELREALAADVSDVGRALIMGGRSAAPADDDDEPHFRFKLKCTRSSCPYDAVLREEQMDVIKQHVRDMWRAGVAGEINLIDGTDRDGKVRRDVDWFFHQR